MDFQIILIYMNLPLLGAKKKKDTHNIDVVCIDFIF